MNSKAEILTEITAGIKMSELGEMKIIYVSSFFAIGSLVPYILKIGKTSPQL